MYMYLVRHLEYDNPQKIYPFHLPVYLSAKGRKDAGIIASWFTSKRLEGLDIYTSPMVRCVQTAEIIASKISSYVAIDDRLVEISCPNLQGKKWILPDSWKAEELDKSRESREVATKRIVNFFMEKVAQQRDCISVSHGEPLTLLYYYLMRKKVPKYLWDPAKGHLVIKKGDVVIVEFKKGRLISTEKIHVIEGQGKIE